MGATPLAKNCGQAANREGAEVLLCSVWDCGAVGCKPQLVVCSATTPAVISAIPKRRMVAEGRFWL